MIGLGIGLSKIKYVGSGAPADATAPTVQSATIPFANKDSLVVVFSEAVNVTNVTGLSLDGDLSSYTITAIESGNGTDTVTFTLSENVPNVMTGNFVYGGTNTIKDLATNALVSGSTAVTVTESLGTEKLLNPTFSSGSNWSLQNGSSISGGEATAVGSGSLIASAANHVVYQDFSALTNGTRYKGVITWKRTVGTGNSYVGIKFAAQQTIASLSASYVATTFYFTAGASGYDRFTFGAASGTTVVADEVSLKEVL